jgi:hypothetical protein
LGAHLLARAAAAHEAGRHHCGAVLRDVPEGVRAVLLAGSLAHVGKACVFGHGGYAATTTTRATVQAQRQDARALRDQRRHVRTQRRLADAAWQIQRAQRRTLCRTRRRTTTRRAAASRAAQDARRRGGARCAAPATRNGSMPMPSGARSARNCGSSWTTCRASRPGSPSW